MPAKERRNRPATSLEQQENQMIALATDLARKQMQDGTASAQVITHYLKLGTVREQMERDRLVQEVALWKAKAESIGSSARYEEAATEALKAFRGYRGEAEDEYYE